MPNSANSNSGSTDTTSAAGAAHRSDEAGRHETEADYLSEQAAAARAAMRGVLGDLQDNVRSGWERATDVRGWIDRHPWFAVGAASAAGFAAAAAVTPGPGQTLRDKLSSTIEAAMSQAEAADGQVKSEEARPARAHSQPSLWAMLLEPVVDVLKVAAQNYFTAYVAGQAAAQAAHETDTDETCAAPDAASSAESSETNASAMA